MTLVHVKTTRERDDAPARQLPGDERTGMSDYSRRGKPRHIGERYLYGILDLGGKSAQTRPEYDSQYWSFRANALANRGSTFLGGGSPVRSTQAASLASVDISPETFSRSFTRCSQGRNALSNPLRASVHSSSKVKSRCLAANAYSSLSVVPLINLLSVLSVRFIPRSKYARRGCVSYDLAACVWMFDVRQISRPMRRSLTYCVSSGSSINRVACPRR